jgi:hypothetical protein
MSRTPRWPTIGAVLGFLGLLIAIGGTGYAAGGGGSNDPGVAPASKAASGASTPSAIASKPKRGPRGKRGLRGPAGPRGLTGPTGPGGAVGPAGSALAFAYIGVDNTLDPSLSKNVQLLSIPTPGLYCMNVTAGTPQNVVATLGVSALGSVTDHIRASVLPTNVSANCPGVTDADTVVETAASTGTRGNRPFSIVAN